ncbi:MAG TPA: 30S ribosomal protein S2 [Bacteroidia bacterium]|jgi:small subunit ribosomal protein S2|nr:30S ribosomal protein S2 [Bacteroidia bacterium]HNO70350.1 30S ribosomal protein S2 [Bacteroidia bacterium]
MSRVTFDQLLNAGAHYGHLTRKWNPAMAPYIFGDKNSIHIIDLNKTSVKLEEAANALKQIAKSGRKILFVATKKQVKNVVAEKAKSVNMPYVTERWPGGMLTNFVTIRRSIREMATIDRMRTDGTMESMNKKERLMLTRHRDKLQTLFGSIADLTRLPAALFVVDVNIEHIAVAEAKRLNIPTFAIVDTNSDPNVVEFPIPANDDAETSVDLIVGVITKAIEEGLQERKADKDAVDKEKTLIEAAAEEEQKEREEKVKKIEKKLAVEEEGKIK